MGRRAGKGGWGGGGRGDGCRGGHCKEESVQLMPRTKQYQLHSAGSIASFTNRRPSRHTVSLSAVGSTTEVTVPNCCVAQPQKLLDC